MNQAMLQSSASPYAAGMAYNPQYGMQQPEPNWMDAMAMMTGVPVGGGQGGIPPAGGGIDGVMGDALQSVFGKEGITPFKLLMLPFALPVISRFPTVAGLIATVPFLEGVTKKADDIADKASVAVNDFIKRASKGQLDVGSDRVKGLLETIATEKSIDTFKDPIVRGVDNYLAGLGPMAQQLRGGIQGLLSDGMIRTIVYASGFLNTFEEPIKKWMEKTPWVPDGIKDFLFNDKNILTIRKNLPGYSGADANLNLAQATRLYARDVEGKSSEVIADEMLNNKLSFTRISRMAQRIMQEENHGQIFPDGQSVFSMVESVNNLVKSMGNGQGSDVRTMQHWLEDDFVNIPRSLQSHSLALASRELNGKVDFHMTDMLDKLTSLYENMGRAIEHESPPPKDVTDKWLDMVHAEQSGMFRRYTQMGEALLRSMAVPDFYIKDMSNTAERMIYDGRSPLSAHEEKEVKPDARKLSEVDRLAGQWASLDDLSQYEELETYIRGYVQRVEKLPPAAQDALLTNGNAQNHFAAVLSGDKGLSPVVTSTMQAALGGLGEDASAKDILGALKQHFHPQEVTKIVAPDLQSVATAHNAAITAEEAGAITHH